MIALLNSDARYLPLADRSVHCAITSPPYWGLRSYGVEPGVWGGDPDCVHEWVEAFPPSVPKRGNKPGDYSTSSLTNPERQDQVSRGTQSGQWCQHCGAWRGCLGLEPTPDLYVEHIVACMREVWRVLRDDGTLWLNLGDSYAGSWGNSGAREGGQRPKNAPRYERHTWDDYIQRPPMSHRVPGLKPKDLCMIPARVALALQADGWWLRSALPWVKRSSMPESVTDRPASSLEYVFMLAKQPRYYFDMEAVRRKGAGNINPAGANSRMRVDRDPAHGTRKQDALGKRTWTNFNDRWRDSVNSGAEPNGRSWRNGDLWFDSVGMLLADNGEILGFDVNPRPYSGAHFAVFPEDLIEPMVLAGTSARGCCPKCGAPWVRVVERDTDYPDEYGNMGAKGSKWQEEDSQSSGHRIQKNMNALRAAGRNHDNPFPVKQTVGWRPSCNCDTGDPIPCTVLDPFSGTATVGRVCARHGRRFVGGDLNREYIALAHKRTSGVQMELGA